MIKEGFEISGIIRFYMAMVLFVSKDIKDPIAPKIGQQQMFSEYGSDMQIMNSSCLTSSIENLSNRWGYLYCILVD